MAETTSRPTTSTSRNESFYYKEREKKVLELYHTKGKRYSYIQKELKISPNTINAILKRDREEKEKEREKASSVYNIGDNSDGASGNGDGRTIPATTGRGDQQQQNQKALPITRAATAALELSTKEKAAISYKLYDEGKTPVEVATTLYLPATVTIMKAQIQVSDC